MEESGTVNSSILTMDCTDPEVDNKSRSFQVGNKRVNKRDQIFAIHLLIRFSLLGSKLYCQLDILFYKVTSVCV